MSLAERACVGSRGGDEKLDCGVLTLSFSRARLPKADLLQL